MGKSVRTLTITIILAVFLAACGGGGGSTAGTTANGGGSTTGAPGSGAAKDTIAPVVSYTTPANHATGVTTNSSVTFTFSEPINPATITFTINGIQGKVAYDPASRSATFSHQGLNSNSAYRASITSGVTDLAGNAMANEYVWTFTTSATADAGAPSVTSWVPGPANVPNNSAITAVFSEPMDIPSVTNAFTLREQTTASPVTGSVEYIGGTATFKPAIDLKAGTSYTASIATSASDLAGNKLVDTNSTWTFTTSTTSNYRDDTAPEIILGSVMPADGATDVPETSLLSIAFNEPIYPFLYGTIDGVPGTISFDYANNNNRATLTPSQNLKQGSKYTVSIKVMDLAGNAMPTPFTWSFTVRTSP